MGKLRPFLAVIFTAAIFGYFVYAAGPGLIRDWRLRGVETVEVSSELTDGDCRVYLLAVNFCTLKLNTADGAVDDMLLFVDMASGDGFDVVARADAADQHQVTTGLALDHFWNRVVTLAVFLALMGFGFFGGVALLFKPNDEPSPNPA